MLFLVGINHRTAPVELRERVAFPPDALAPALDELVSMEGVREAVVLSTCNRTEIVVHSEPEAGGPVRTWLASRAGLDEGSPDCTYIHSDVDAIHHVIAVACGLDSMVLGEPQILGQTKEAYRLAGDAGSTGPLLNRLYQHVFGTAKLVRSATGIGASPVSVAFAAITLARQIFADFGTHTALLVGAGDTIELVARHLHGQGIGRMIIANRSVERAHDLAQELGAFAIGLDEITAHLAEADMLISSTASPRPLIGDAMVREALAGRRRRPLFMVDLAVPRDIEASVSAIEDVYLYTVDDLQQVIAQGLEARQRAADEALELVETEARRIAREIHAMDAAPLIRGLREGAERTRREMLEHARRRLAAGDPVEEVLEELSRRLTRKLLHHPSTALREAGSRGDEDLLAAARRILDVGDGEDGGRHGP